jgi:hypothetical protein
MSFCVAVFVELSAVSQPHLRHENSVILFIRLMMGQSKHISLRTTTPAAILILFLGYFQTKFQAVKKFTNTSSSAVTTEFDDMRPGTSSQSHYTKKSPSWLPVKF